MMNFNGAKDPHYGTYNNLFFCYRFDISLKVVNTKFVKDVFNKPNILNKGQVKQWTMCLLNKSQKKIENARLISTNYAEDYPKVDEWLKNWKMDDDAIGELMVAVNEAEEPINGAEK